MRQKLGVLVFAIVLISISVFSAMQVWKFKEPERTHLRNLDLAWKHIKVIGPVIQNDSRFRFVTLGPDTNGRGTLGIGGFVASEDDLKDLSLLISSLTYP